MADDSTVGQPNNRWLRGTAILFLLLTGGAIIGRIVLHFSACQTAYLTTIDEWGVILLAGPGFSILGVLITFYRPTNRIAWLCLISGLSLPLLETINTFIACGLQSDVIWASLPYAAWFNYAIIAPTIILSMFILLPMLFPTGRFVSPRWYRLTLIILVSIFLLNSLIALTEDFTVPNGVDFSYPLENPLGLIPVTITAAVGRLLNFVQLAAALLAVASIVVRFRRSKGDERQQIKWFAYFLGTVVFTQLFFFEFLAYNYIQTDSPLAQTTEGRWINLAYSLVLLVVLAGFPTTIGMAIFKYRLYDIDIIIRRTVQYASVSAILAATYYGTVVFLQTLFTSTTSERSPLVIVVSTLVTAALFNPLRTRLQTFIDRRFYRRKYSAEQIMAHFAQTAQDEVEIDALQAELVRVVQETMQPEKITLWLKQ